MTVTLTLKPEIEASLLAQAREAGMTLEGYLQSVIEREFPIDSVEPEHSEDSGMVWENGLLIYGAGLSLPPGYLDTAIERSREERIQSILGNRS